MDGAADVDEPDSPRLTEGGEPMRPEDDDEDEAADEVRLDADDDTMICACSWANGGESAAPDVVEDEVEAEAG